MSNIQVIILIIVAVIVVLAIWNLVISIQNMINEKKFNKYKKFDNKSSSNTFYQTRLY